MSHRNVAGFTLLEVMVALAIVAIALGAVLSTSAKDTGNLTHLRDKTLANWVALNQLNLLEATREFPDLPRIQGVEFMANRNWYYNYEIKDTPIPMVQRVDIEVRSSSDSRAPVLATASAFFDKENEQSDSDELEADETESIGEESP